MCNLVNKKTLSNITVMCNGCEGIFMLEEATVLFEGSKSKRGEKVHMFEVRTTVKSGSRWSCPLCGDWGWYILVYCQDNNNNSFRKKLSNDNREFS